MSEEEPMESDNLNSISPKKAEAPENIETPAEPTLNNENENDEESLRSLSGDEESENDSDGMDTDDDFNSLREEALKELENDSSHDDNMELSQIKEDLKDSLPADFMRIYDHLNEPKTMGGVVSLTDSDSDEDFDDDNSSELKCMVTSCGSKKKVKVRSRLVTSYFGLSTGLSYVESPVICHKCFVKAAKFYRKIAKITPDKMKFLINDNICKPTDCIDISDDTPIKSEMVKMLEKESIAPEIARNIHLHINKVAQEHNIEDKFSKIMNKMESKIGKMTVWINELICKIDMDDQDMVNKLQQTYTSYDVPLKQGESVDLGIIDADNPEVNRNWETEDENRTHKSSSTIEIDSFSDPDIAIVEDEVDSVQKKPSSLPPRGMIVRKKPTVGQKVYVSRKGVQDDWVPATVESVLIHETAEKNFKYTYKVRLNVNPSTIYVKEVCEEQMAYYEPSSVRIAVGNRVISALYMKKSNEPRKYFSGIIAESPSSNNNYRYLIFFDTMAVQYSQHDDLRITCNMTENMHEYFHPTHQAFIRRYFEALPKRKILTINTMDIVKVEHKGCWVDAQVTAVDGLLMEVFYKQKEPTEWLYRGSPRVMSKDMYRHKLLRSLAEGSFKQTSRGVVAEDDPVDIQKVKELIVNKKVLVSGKSNDNNSVRAVARKTITRMPETVHQPAVSRSIYQSRGGKDEFAGFVKSYKDLGASVLYPRDMGSHKCSEPCISWTNKTLDTCRGRNPLVIPMLFAFKRVDVMPMGGGARQIFYESPCGKKLDDFDQLLIYLQKTNCQLSVDYFNFDPWVSVWDEFKAAPEGFLLKDLSYGKEFSPIPVINTVDHDLPPYMNYMVMRNPTDGVPLNLEKEFLIGCDCEDDCSNKSTCPCWQKTVKDYLDLIVTPNSEIDAGMNLMDYSNIGYQNKRLVEYVPSGIYECNSTCKCSHTCLNRVVQLPLKVKLELFKTRHKGWGTRCLNDIPAGGFICVYVGNILTEKAANEDGKLIGDEYFAELDYIEVMERLMNKPGYESGPSDPEASDEEDEEENRDSGNAAILMKLRSRKKEDKKTRLKRSTTDQGKLNNPQVTGGQISSLAQLNKSDNTDDGNSNCNTYIPLRLLYGNLASAKESVYIIDAKTAGNIGRYFNHSCEPNIFVQNVFVDTHDLRFPWVAFFAKQHIRAGSELTWDYQYIVDSVPGKRLYCYCGSRICRGRLL